MNRLTWVDYMWTAFMFFLMVAIIIAGAVYEYVRFMAYWKIAFGGQ